MNNLKDIIIPYNNIDENGKEIKGIGIDIQKCQPKDVTKIKKIKYPNFFCRDEYFEAYDDEKELKKDILFVEIKNLPDNLVKEVINTVKDIINKDNLMVSDAINEVIDYFKKYKLDTEVKKILLGDLAETIFIYKCLYDKNINIINNLREVDNNLYDFNFNDNVVEVKSASSEKNDFMISYEQLNQIKEKMIVIVKYKYLEGQTSILDLYNLIEKKAKLNDLLLEKKKHWEDIKNETIAQDVGDLINRYTVNLDHCHLNIFNNNNLPIVDIKTLNACKKITFTISCTDDQLENIDKFYEWYDAKCKIN